MVARHTSHPHGWILKLQAGDWRTWRHPCAWRGEPACEGAPWRAWKPVTWCHHLTQHHQGMLLLSKLEISPGLGITTTFPPLPFLGQIWCKEASSYQRTPRQPGLLEQRGFSGWAGPFGSLVTCWQGCSANIYRGGCMRAPSLPHPFPGHMGNQARLLLSVPAAVCSGRRLC